MSIAQAYIDVMYVNSRVNDNTIYNIDIYIYTPWN